ncbi:MAG: 7,8-dihydroneopterin aldolase/epimerase/oxygenase [Eubacteriales bacterium]|nr:7,8-dihydroneopterin aldolase/epimerase/oxygenase [Eubacteriales bacterium]MDN5362993.1 7,8-dihydroneopterin aldolase/epimerase/oxygenase [Eubacteriales bacterium]
MATDKIILAGMKFYGHHGVLPEERKLGQCFVVDVELYVSLQVPGIADELHTTVDYAKVYEVIRARMEGPPFRLLEALAESIASDLLEVFPVDTVKLRIMKPGAPVNGIFDYMGVEITRSRSLEYDD